MRSAGNDGGLSVVKKAMYLPVTCKDLAWQKSDISYPIELIVDGEIIFENLTRKNLTME